MDNYSSARNLLWEEQQRARKAQGRSARRQWLKRFAFALALIVFAVAMGTILAHMGAGSRG